LEAADITGDATASIPRPPRAGDRRADPHRNGGPWTPANAGAAGAQADRPGNRNKTPLFPASERQMGRADILRRLALSAAETAPDAISCPTSPARPDPAPVMDAARLARRFAALAAVLANPEPHALRLAKRMHQGKAVLRLGTAPALARGGTLDLGASAYFEAERLALTVLNRGAPVWPNALEPPIPAKAGIHGSLSPPGAPVDRSVHGPLPAQGSADKDVKRRRASRSPP
ncbi:MAG: hypothetical protein AAFY10_14510, partial [Pseudomonadota bacterium]